MSENSDIGKQLGTINGKLDSLLEYRQDHEARIRVLEAIIQQQKGGWKLLIMFSGVAGSMGALVGWIASHFKI